ncbi:hypothetical protein V7T09_09585 [Segatella copri]|nr:hypothetical protein [Segatella copri]
MKKEYIEPEMQVHEIKAQQMLTGSQPEFNNKSPEDGNEDMW